MRGDTDSGRIYYGTLERIKRKHDKYSYRNMWIWKYRSI